MVPRNNSFEFSLDDIIYMIWFLKNSKFAQYKNRIKWNETKWNSYIPHNDTIFFSLPNAISFSLPYSLQMLFDLSVNRKFLDLKSIVFGKNGRKIVWNTRRVGRVFILEWCVKERKWVMCLRWKRKWKIELFLEGIKETRRQLPFNACLYFFSLLPNCFRRFFSFFRRLCILCKMSKKNTRRFRIHVHTWLCFECVYFTRAHKRQYVP